MRERCLAIVLALFGCAFCCARPVHAAEAEIAVTPANVELVGNFARGQLLVTQSAGQASSDRCDDLTARAIYQSSDPLVVDVDSAGQLLAKGNGETTVTVRVDSARIEVPVVVRVVEQQPRVEFTKDV